MKAIRRHLRPTEIPAGPEIFDQEPIYYEQWEQEYGENGALLNGQPAFASPPFPSPTPYGRAGNTYSFGQRVELAPLHLAVRAVSDGMLADGRQRVLVELNWVNPTEQPVPFDYLGQVWLRSVRRDDGTNQIGDGWGIDPTEATRLGLTIPASITPGEQRVQLPILAPAGHPYTIEVRMPIAAIPSTGTVTLTPNAELRSTSQRWLTVQWVDAAPVGPPCDDPGALTDWSSDEQKAIPRDAAVQLPAPVGAPRVVQVARDQVGKRYVWGAAGPDRFDCSGLMYWSYAQIGIAIPRTTATQWPGMTRVALNQIQLGDLVFMDTREQLGATRAITHVGMLADLDGDGRWDLIHAANPRLGVRVEYDVLHSAYYAPRMFGEGRTAR